MNVLPFNTPSASPTTNAAPAASSAGYGYRIYPLIPSPPPPTLTPDRKAALRERLDSGFYFQPDNLRTIARCLARDLSE